MLRVQTRNFLLGCALSAEESGARSTQLRRRGRLTGSRPAAVEPFGMMPSRLSSKRPDLMNKDAEHASLKLDQATETDEKWTLASGDKKHAAGDARAREKPAFASSNHANSTPAAAAGTIETTTLLHASPPLVAIDKSSNFSSAARTVSACQPMQPCPTYSAASNKPALQSRAQASGMPINTKSDSTAAKRGVAAHKPTAGEFIAGAGKRLLLAASIAISALSLAAPELHEASNALSPLAGYEQQVETLAGTPWGGWGWVGQGLGGRHPLRDRWDGWDASGWPHV